MKKVTRLFATCLLVIALSAVAFADGGDTLTPPQASPQPPSAESTTEEPSTTPQDSSIDILTEATAMLVAWLQVAIF